MWTRLELRLRRAAASIGAALGTPGMAAACLGLVGCVLPWLAGPPFNFVGLILLTIAKDGKQFSPGFMILMGVLMINWPSRGSMVAPEAAT